ncbi:tryptophan dimethylallyltransferase family protein [Streptomyces phytophilus]|uniref:tryptophan dimethylallyltransferase family protein n=1 Tax=Streptomyces phytophilus TaxID=722715 RepID=UPI0015EFDC7B|nr:tryptophan dimethylallyltransferase family protein [Streptomyces phytophilus]
MDARSSRVPEARPHPDTTFTEYTIPTLKRLLACTGLDAESGASTVRTMLASWGDQPIGTEPVWGSFITTDTSPVEFSAAFGRTGTEVRVCVEAQPPRPTTADAQATASRLTRRLVEHAGISTRRLDAIRDLFLPGQDAQGWAMAHAVGLSEKSAPNFKVYLNANASPAMTADERVRVALERLGFGQAWEPLRAFADRGSDLDPVVYISLDLSDQPDARVKVYFLHRDITPAHWDSKLAVLPAHRPGSVEEFATGLTQYTGPQPVITNFTFTAQGGQRPESATAYVPLWHYVASDQVACDRVRHALTTNGIPDKDYRSLLSRVARKPLDESWGIHSFASIRLGHSGSPITVYLSPMFYGKSRITRREITELFPNLDET